MNILNYPRTIIINLIIGGGGKLIHFERLNLQPTNFEECACLKAVLCRDMVLQDSLKLLSFMEITVHPQK